jgi:hypothetical protein
VRGYVIQWRDLTIDEDRLIARHNTKCSTHNCVCTVYESTVKYVHSVLDVSSICELRGRGYSASNCR